MTREELKEHCKKQIEMCEMWAKAKGEEPCGKVYEEHKLILELLEQEPCEYAISRQAVLDQTYLWSKDEFLRVTNPFDYLRKRINSLPPVTPQPKIGHWIRFKNFENGYYHIKCSECGQYWSVDGHANIFKHCFNCGVKMEEEKNG